MSIRVAAVLPSRDEALTVAGVAQAVDHAIGARPALIVNADSSSDDQTHDAFQHDAFQRAALHASGLGLRELPRGKGIQVAHGLTQAAEADCVLMIDTDTRNPSPARYRRLIDAVLGGADLALLKYRRPWFEANLTNHVARPLVAAATGLDVPQPIVGDIALSRRAAADVLARYEATGGEIRTCIDGYGIDAFITRTIALHSSAVASVPVDAVKQHAPSFPHLPVIFHEAVPVLLAHEAGAETHPPPWHPVFTLAPATLPVHTLRDMRRRLARMRRDAEHPLDGSGQTWPQPLVDAWHQVRAGCPPDTVARSLWPAYIDRVRSYLSVASGPGGCPAAERSLASAMSAFLAHASHADDPVLW